MRFLKVGACSMIVPLFFLLSLNVISFSVVKVKCQKGCSYTDQYNKRLIKVWKLSFGFITRRYGHTKSSFLVKLDVHKYFSILYHQWFWLGLTLHTYIIDTFFTFPRTDQIQVGRT
jgi:hypothetical protein